MKEGVAAELSQAQRGMAGEDRDYVSTPRSAIALLASLP